jgi:hypothetical protein
MTNRFKEGDIVKVTRKKDPLGGVPWPARMTDTINQVGKVLGLSLSGNTSVEFDGGEAWSYHPDSLELVSVASVRSTEPIKTGQFVEVTTYGSVYQGKQGRIVDREINPERWGIYFPSEDVVRYFYTSELRNVKPPSFEGSPTATPIISKEPVMPQLTPYPTTQENNMSSVDSKQAVQQVTFIFGQDAANVTDSAVFELIRKLEGEIANLDAIKNKPAKLKAEIANKKAQIDELVKFVDNRT